MAVKLAAIRPLPCWPKSGKALFLAKALIAMAVSAAAALICLVYTNFGVLKNIGLDGTFGLIPADSAYIISGTDGSTDIVFKESGGIYINKLIFDVDNAGRLYPADIKISVRTKGYGGKGFGGGKLDYTGADGEGCHTYVFTDRNPIYVRTEVVNLDLTNVASLHIETDGHEAAASGFRIDNTVNKNIKAAGTAFILALALMAAILWRDFFARKPEYLFLAATLSMGISMISGMPKTKVGYDEETHMRDVLAIANYPDPEVHMTDGGLYQVLVTEYNNPSALPDGFMEVSEYEDRLDEECSYTKGDKLEEFAIHQNRVPAYLTMAAAARLSSRAGLPWTGIVSAIRLANLLTYAIFMFFAIRIVPFGKALMMLTGLLPQMIFMASTCSYDPFIAGSISLGYAFMLRGRKYCIPMLICFVLGCLPKAVYAPVLIMGMFMLAGRGGGAGPGICKGRLIRFNMGSVSRTGADSPPMDGAHKPSAKGNVKRHDFIIVLICIAVFIAIIAAFILPTAMAPSDSGDLRGGDVSEMGQIGFILSQPLAYASILIRQIIRDFGRCWFSADCMTYMAHLANAETRFEGYYIPYMVILVLIIAMSHAWTKYRRNDVHGHGNGDGYGREGGYGAEHENVTGHGCEDDYGYVCGQGPGYGCENEYVRFTFTRRICVVSMTVLSAVLIWTAMYVAFTVPGSSEIAGVQGRYFIPLMFPLYLAICGNTDREASLWQAVRHVGKDDTARDGCGSAKPGLDESAAECKMGNPAAERGGLRALEKAIEPINLTYLAGLAELITLGATVWTAVIVPFCL